MKFRHIRTRLALTMTVLAISMLIAMGTLLAYLYSSEMLENMRTITDQNLQLMNNVLEDQVKDIYGLFDEIQGNERLQEWVDFEPGNENEQYERMRGISTILREYAYADVGITSIFMVDANGQVLDPLYITQPYSNIIERYSALEKFQMNDVGKQFSLPSHFPNKLEEASGEKTNITYFDTYLSVEDYSRKGTLMITVKMDYFFQNFKNEAKDKFESIMIANENGDEVVSFGTAYPREKLTESIKDSMSNNGIMNYDRQSYYYNLRKIDAYPQWTVVGIVPYDRLRIGIGTIWNILMGISLVSFVIIAFASILISSKITDPILQLGNSMNAVERGDWPDPIVPQTEDELKTLIDGFNSMVEEQQNLIERIYEEEEHKKELEISAIQMKLDLLQSQINPHFIHNTLNAIQYTIMSDRIADASNMLRAFNILLRASMSHDKDFISVREEIECLNSYADIQKIRYDNVFDLNVEIEEDLLDLKIPKLLLQPIVENAIFHGVVPKGKPGKIEVDIYAEDADVVFTISDDGVGMASADIDALLIRSETTDKSAFNRISFKNINNRLLLAYGNEEGLQITSRLGEGTTVAFTIPFD